MVELPTVDHDGHIQAERIAQYDAGCSSRSRLLFQYHAYGEKSRVHTRLAATTILRHG